MGEAQIRTGYDAVLAFQVVAPGNGSAYANLFSLLTAPQQAEITAATAAGYFVCGVAMTPAAAINWKHSTPGSNPATVSVSSNGFPVNATQKPNELIPMINAHLNVWLQSASASPVNVNISLNCVSKDTL